MIKSMTGYGCAKGTSEKLELTAELRSVNNRYLDCNVRIPRVYTAVEDAIKALVQSRISRGKVDVYITIDSSRSDNVSIVVNEPLADAYTAILSQIAERYSLKNDLTAMSLIRLPDVLSVEKQEVDTDKLAEDICRVLSQAMDDFTSMRICEGEKMYADISSRLDIIESLTARAEERSPKTVAEYRARLENRMKDVLQSANIDENRILLEAAVFADKVAVAEETVRLRSHISQFRGMLESEVPVGRKLDFLIQEMNREANTMGSKGNDTEMARIVIDIKAEIEKIREQVQNIE